MKEGKATEEGHTEGFYYIFNVLLLEVCTTEFVMLLLYL